MKILLIGPVPPHLGSKNPGGIAHHLWSLAKNLKNKGHKVSILAIGRYYKSTREKDGIVIYGIQKKIFSLLKSILFAPFLLFRIGIVPSRKTFVHALYSLFRINTLEHVKEYDIIHLHGIHNSALYVLEMLGINIPKVVTIHSYHDLLNLEGKEQNKRIAYINDYLNAADCLVHVSKADKLKGNKLGVLFEGINEVIHNGLEVRSEGQPLRSKEICFVGLLIPRKRISVTLNAIQYFKSNIQVVNIAGDGPLRDEVEAAARKNSLISYHGVIPNPKVREMMSKSSLLVVPSLSESFGLVYIEALFEGTGVLGYGPILKEFQEVMELTEDEKKLVVPISSEDITPRELAEKIDAAYEFRQTETGIETMKNIRQKAIDNFSWPSIIHKVEKMYQEVVNHS